MCDLPPPSLLISFSAQFGLIFEFISDMDAFSSFERNSRGARKPLAAQFNLISFCGQCCEFMKFLWVTVCVDGEHSEPFRSLPLKAEDYSQSILFLARRLFKPYISESAKSWT